MPSFLASLIVLYCTAPLDDPVLQAVRAVGGEGAGVLALSRNGDFVFQA